MTQLAKTQNGEALATANQVVKTVYRRGIKVDTPDNGVGFTLWADDREAVTIYGEEEYDWEMDVTSENSISVDELQSMARPKIEEQYESKELPYEFEGMIDMQISFGRTTSEAIDIIVSEFDTPDIVDSAGAFDYPDVMEFLWENFEEELGNKIIITDDGAVTFAHDQFARKLTSQPQEAKQG